MNTVLFGLILLSGDVLERQTLWAQHLDGDEQSAESCQSTHLESAQSKQVQSEVFSWLNLPLHQPRLLFVVKVRAGVHSRLLVWLYRYCQHTTLCTPLN